MKDQEQGVKVSTEPVIRQNVAQGVQEPSFQEQPRLMNILDHLLDGLMIFDREWRYQYINPQAEPFAGKLRDELIGKIVWEEFPHLIGSTFYLQYHHVMLEHESVEFRIYSSLLNHWFDVRAFPIDDGIVVYFREITEKVLAEEERTRLLAATQQAYAEMEAALAVRNNFLASVTHDLKTPLTTIKANFQLVQRRVNLGRKIEENWLHERLEAIERATTKMTGMIDDLLDLSRLQTGKRAVEEFLPLDFMPLLHHVIVEQRAATRRHRIVLKTAEEHLPMRGSTKRLDRVLTNLLDNAIKYSPCGGDITIEVTREAQDGQSWARLTIQDQGVGIPQAELACIFEPFHRASNVVHTIQGTGVGLASVTQVIEQHQGTITVASEEGQGSCFTVYLPLL